jgi:hypothetical protein
MKVHWFRLYIYSSCTMTWLLSWITCMCKKFLRSENGVPLVLFIYLLYMCLCFKFVYQLGFMTSLFSNKDKDISTALGPLEI